MPRRVPGNMTMDTAETHSGIRGSIGWSASIHAALFGAMIVTALWKGPKATMGTENALGGAIGVGVVNSIPLPQSSGERNPVADPTQAETPRDVEKR